MKLQLIGDLRQMPAIDAGDLFRQVLRLSQNGAADVAHLDEIRRQWKPKAPGDRQGLSRENRLLRENAREVVDTSGNRSFTAVSEPAWLSTGSGPSLL